MEQSNKKSRAYWVLAIVALVLAVVALTSWRDFRDGFKDGYDAQANQKP